MMPELKWELNVHNKLPKMPWASKDKAFHGATLFHFHYVLEKCVVWNRLKLDSVYDQIVYKSLACEMKVCSSFHAYSGPCGILCRFLFGALTKHTRDKKDTGPIYLLLIIIILNPWSVWIALLLTLSGSSFSPGVQNRLRSITWCLQGDLHYFSNIFT